VYWNANSIAHNPAGSCSGLAVTVKVGSSSGGPFEAYKPMTTRSNNFQYAGQVKAFLSGGKIEVYDVCRYAYDHVPVGADLQVQLTVPQPAAFSPSVAPQFGTAGPIKIDNGQCNMLPKAVPSSLADLTAHWGSCQNRAYNVNFELVRSALSSGGSGGLLSGSGGVQPRKNPGTVGTPVLINPGPINTPLSRNPESAGQAPLTNADVISMLKGGVSEPITIAKIQSSQGKFDFSPGGCRALTEAHVSQKILDTMAAGTNPCLAGRLRARVGLSPSKHSQKITNPNAALHDTAIIAVLRKQRQAADVETAQLKLGIRPVAINLGPQQAMSETMGGRVARAPAPVQSTVPAGTNSPGGSSHLPVAAPVNLLQNLALTCGHDPTMRILTVSGGPQPAIFTQDVKYDFYTITGCSFGDPGPNSKAYIYYQGTFHQDFQIQEWSDNWIKLSLDPSLKGVDDQDNLTLVVQRADGKQASKSGFKFYAARETILLSNIPRQYFGLDRFRPDQALTNNWQATYTSPSSASVTPNLPGITAEVHWDLSYVSDESVSGGMDLYDFSNLHPTFVLDSAWMEWRDIACSDSNPKLAVSPTNWGIDWYGPSGIKVTWQGQQCNPVPGQSCGTGWPVKTDCFSGQPESNYGINVWVTGPRGLDPWTGKPSVH
jgi:hypothetical protein